MKLTKQVIDRLVREVLAEKTQELHKNEHERKRYLKKQREEAEDRREKKKELRPDLELMKLSKGILQEEVELLAEPDEEGWVKVKASALSRVLKENTSACNTQGYYKIDQILDFISRMNNAQKGKA